MSVATHAWMYEYEDEEPTFQDRFMVILSFKNRNYW